MNRDAISSRGDALVESVNGVNQASVDFAFKKEKLSFDRANIQKEHDREGNVVWSSKLWNGPSRHENISKKYPLTDLPYHYSEYNDG